MSEYERNNIDLFSFCIHFLVYYFKIIKKVLSLIIISLHTNTCHTIEKSNDYLKKKKKLKLVH